MGKLVCFYVEGDDVAALIPWDVAEKFGVRLEVPKCLESSWGEVKKGWAEREENSRKKKMRKYIKLNRFMHSRRRDNRHSIWFFGPERTSSLIGNQWEFFLEGDEEM